MENAKKPKERGEEKKNKRKAKRENEKIKWKNIKTGNSGVGRGEKKGVRECGKQTLE